eukprot:CAMPEP_0177627394 /NCGR_PEP_ID=MMETSP0419_2-20121207/31181_1 /TAXON_ID=582737 /ORGANISM="Tetraselmis sp., Strain GSL018" /LENGTH=448 /DNA_ID=CAMNT_0019128547 /DNA_START=787 /DNA_END=2131 /DNA_ORIENTATION=+
MAVYTFWNKHHHLQNLFCTPTKSRLKHARIWNEGLLYEFRTRPKCAALPHQPVASGVEARRRREQLEADALFQIYSNEEACGVSLLSSCGTGAGSSAWDCSLDAEEVDICSSSLDDACCSDAFAVYEELSIAIEDQRPIYGNGPVLDDLYFAMERRQATQGTSASESRVGAHLCQPSHLGSQHSASPGEERTLSAHVRRCLEEAQAGDVRSSMGQAQKAAEAYSMALEHHQRATAVLLARRAEALMMLGDCSAGAREGEEAWMRALEDASRAADLDPRLARAHLQLGRAQLRAGRPSEALQAFLAGLAEEPGNGDLLRGRAEAESLLQQSGGLAGHGPEGGESRRREEEIGGAAGQGDDLPDGLGGNIDVDRGGLIDGIARARVAVGGEEGVEAPRQPRGDVRQLTGRGKPRRCLQRPRPGAALAKPSRGEEQCCAAVAAEGGSLDDL